MIPKKLFLTKGEGFHENELQSFELALRDAGIHACNLVRVSSIIPPDCQIITKEEGFSLIVPGMITFCVLSICKTNKLNERIGAGIGIAKTDLKDCFGYIAEAKNYGQMCENLAADVEETAEKMLYTVLKEDDKKSASLQKKSIVQVSNGKKQDVWSTAVAAAVFLM